MKKILNLLIITTLFSFSHSLNVEISLAAHTNSTYGTWEITKIKTHNIDKRYFDKITSWNRAAPFHVEYTDIEIFNKKLYLKEFLKQGYYSLDWIPQKGTLDPILNINKSTKKFLKESAFFKDYHAQDGWEQIDWSMVLADYRNSTISTIPSYELNISNQGKNPITIIGFYTKTIFTTGGEASPGGAYFPTKNKQNLLTLHWGKEGQLQLKKRVKISAKKSHTIPISIFVKKGAQGDGPGKLTFALYIKYKEGKKEKTRLLTIINQSEDYGYFTGW